ncbi:MAG TPA: 2OG-Fe(II) oxygenase [Mycobacterium sp.]|nr:2OG-Fe(II) oxygenase [Mycobacterium sp.]
MAATTTVWQRRVDTADWDAVTTELNDLGGALLPQLVTKAEAAQLRRLYTDDHRFRATIEMSRYRFGEGEYRYFERPYPSPINELKHALYPRLLPIARDWWTKLGRDTPWPDDLDDWLDICHSAGQARSTAILLKYGQGDWNALHRDLYGELVFPLQVVINLSEPGVDHTGGEFLLLEQRPRAQSRGTATLVPHGHGFVFTTRERPMKSARGWSAAPVRHGVSAVRSGERFTLGLVFHDAA